MSADTAKCPMGGTTSPNWEPRLNVCPTPLLPCKTTLSHSFACLTVFVPFLSCHSWIYSTLSLISISLIKWPLCRWTINLVPPNIMNLPLLLLFDVSAEFTAFSIPALKCSVLLGFLTPPSLGLICEVWHSWSLSLCGLTIPQDTSSASFK